MSKHNNIVASLAHMPKPGDDDYDEAEAAALAGAPIGTCSICGGITALPFETPVDPPFFPSTPGRHCVSCEQWLLGKDES